MDSYVENIQVLLISSVDGVSVAPSDTNFFCIRTDVDKLGTTKKETFHHVMVKHFYICGRKIPDIFVLFFFLTTRFNKKEEEDWKKLICGCK